MSERWFLGLDSSTQGLKATVIDEALQVVHAHAVNYDRDLPEFETDGGVHQHDDGLTVTAPPLMWAAALDLLLDALHGEGVDLSRVAAVSGSGQQHGSVWLNGVAQERLRHLKPSQSLRRQLEGCFSIETSPVWMDASTTSECRALEAALGGPDAVAALTGSRAYERFTGNQIAKWHRLDPDAYAHTERIALVSSFMASLLVGDFAPIDMSDGSGMNLLDIRQHDWDPAALDHTAPGLAPRLGHPAPSHAVVGRVHPFYVARYGFDAECRVVAFSGDNPNSLAGLRLQEAGDIAVSMGTSDTCFGSLAEPQPSGEEGHIFVNPIDPEAYMAMIVFQNGSLTREAIRDRCAGGSWDTFGGLLQSTMPGNGGNIGIYIDVPEITPPLQQTGHHRWAADGSAVDSFEPAVDVRAVVEGRFMAMARHAGALGMHPARILATGGASANPAILKVMADVLNAPVFIADSSDSASLGAAYRAVHGWRCHNAEAFVPFAEVMQAAPAFTAAATPEAAAHDVYRAMMPRYAACEDAVAAAGTGN